MGRSSEALDPSSTTSPSRVHVSQIWEFVEQSINDGVSMAKLAQIKRKESHAGAKSGSVNYWQRKALSMYHENTTFASFAASNTFHLVSDGSVHGGHETQVTVFFNQKERWACVGTSQRLWPAKIAAPGEFDVDTEIQRILARREAERLNAYKLLQALSKQLSLITRGRTTLASMEPPADLRLLLEPLKPGDSRQVIDNGVYQIHKVDRTDIDIVNVLMESENVSMLCTLMDQSATNMAGMAYLSSRLSLTHGSWDKIHRLVRDLKLSQEHSKNKTLVKAQLASSYLWSMNYRPFGTGHWYQEKRAIVESFVQTESVVAGCKAQ